MRIRMVLVSTLAVLALAFGGVLQVSAQDGSLADAGYPELTVTLTDEGVEGLPEETEAGWHLVNFTNDITPSGDPFEDSWGLDFVLIPEGMTIDDIAAAFAGPPPGEGEGPGAASPEPMEGMDMGSPAADAAPSDPFAFLYETYLPGGPGALQGETTQAAIYLEPGEYAVLAFGFGAPATLTVTGEGDAASAEESGVTADATIVETGESGTFDFEVASLPEGEAVIEIVNESNQPHFIFALRSDVPLTEEEVQTLLTEEAPPEGEDATPVTASPEAGGPGGPPIAPAFITGTQSADTTQYVSVDLEPGYYVLLCFVGDPEQGGIPHAFEGMIEIVPAGAAEATPAG